MIRLENISKDFVVDGKTVHAVKDVTIEIDKGADLWNYRFLRSR